MFGDLGRDERKTNRIKQEQINRAIAEHNRTHVDDINRHLAEIDQLDREYAQKIVTLKNDSLAIEAARRADQVCRILKSIYN